MSAKLVALYRRPDDPEAFLRLYRQVHEPTVRQMPRLQSMVVAR